MDSHHSVLSATGGLPAACDRVDPGPVLHRAVEGGLEGGKGTKEDGKGDEEAWGAVAASQRHGQTRSVTKTTKEVQSDARRDRVLQVKDQVDGVREVGGYVVYTNIAGRMGLDT